MSIWLIWEFLKWFFTPGQCVIPLIGPPNAKEEFPSEVLAIGEYNERAQTWKVLRFKAVVEKPINYPLMVLEEPSAEKDIRYSIFVILVAKAIAVVVLGTLIVMKLKNIKLFKVKPVEQEPKEIPDLNRGEQEPKEYLDLNPVELEQEPEEFHVAKAEVESRKELLDLNPIDLTPQECLDLNLIEQEPEEFFDLSPIKLERKEFLVLKAEAETQTDDQLYPDSFQSSMPEELVGWSMGYRILSEEEIMAKPEVD